MKPRALVVDDKTSMVGLVARVLEGCAETVAAGTVREAIAVLERDRVDAVICDLRLPDGDGLEVLRAVKRQQLPPPFILMTAYASVETAVAAMRSGAYDYVTKPFDPQDLRGLVEGALLKSPRAVAAPPGLGPLLGRSPKMTALFDVLRKIAPSAATVLVQGETGTGKELVARAIHELSPRSHRPFFAIDCGAVPRELLEAELFGHTRGAFTGAATERAGLFEAAQGSTLLLGEIGDLGLPLQAKLKRVLERRVIRRLGDAHERPIDIRIVATTHRKLRDAIDDGRFREDLWFRLSACSVDIPPLRERREDIPLLAVRALEERGPMVGARATSLSTEVMERLVAYDWPGNVRELRGVIERAALVEPGERIEVASLPSDIRVDPAEHPLTDAYLANLSLQGAHELARDEMNRRYLTLLLRKHGGDVAEVAGAAEVERESVYRLLRKYGLSAGGFRERPPQDEKPKT